MGISEENGPVYRSKARVSVKIMCGLVMFILLSWGALVLLAGLSSSF